MTNIDYLKQSLEAFRSHNAEAKHLGWNAPWWSVEAIINRLAEAVAEIEALQQKRNKMQWQPIETAPKDGTRIIVFRPIADPNYIPHVGMDWWGSGVLYPSGAWQKSRRDTPPTHWMPLPQPPEDVK